MLIYVEVSNIFKLVLMIMEVSIFIYHFLSVGTNYIYLSLSVEMYYMYDLFFLIIIILFRNYYFSKVSIYNPNIWSIKNSKIMIPIKDSEFQVIFWFKSFSFLVFKHIQNMNLILESNFTYYFIYFFYLFVYFFV
jgi:hypothetical protein